MLHTTKPSQFTIVLLGFVATGMVLYILGGFVMLMVVAASHTHDLTPEAEQRLGWLIWLLALLPAVWLLFLIASVREIRSDCSAKRLALYVVSPLLGGIGVVGVTWIAAWFVTLPK